MQNTTKLFMEAHSDELHDALGNCYDGDMRELVSEYVKSAGVEGLDEELIAVDAANNELHGYYDDGHAGGCIIIDFFEHVGYAGYNDWDKFDSDGHNTDAVLDTDEFTAFTMGHIAERTGISVEVQLAYETERLRQWHIDNGK